MSSYWLLSFFVLSREDFKLIVWNDAHSFWLQAILYHFNPNPTNGFHFMWQINCTETNKYRKKKLHDNWTKSFIALNANNEHSLMHIHTWAAISLLKLKKESDSVDSRRARDLKFFFGSCVHANQVSKNGVSNRLNHVESIKFTLENTKTETHVASSFISFSTLRCVHWHIHIVFGTLHTRAFAHPRTCASVFNLNPHAIRIKIAISLTYELRS